MHPGPRAPFAAILLGAFCALLSSPAGATEAAGERAIEWMDRFEDAIERAVLEEKPVAVSFTAVWCGWCRKMEQKTYPDAAVAAYADDLVWVRVDGGKHPELARRFSVSAYPTHVFLRPDGSVIASIRGYQEAPPFAALLARLVADRAREFTLRQRLKDHPELLDLQKDLAHLLRRRGAREKALATLDSLEAQARRMDETIGLESRLLRGRLLQEMGRDGEAMEVLAPLLLETRGDPLERGVLFVYAEAAWRSGRTEQAGDAYRRILAVQREGWLAERARERLGREG